MPPSAATATGLVPARRVWDWEVVVTEELCSGRAGAPGGLEEAGAVFSWSRWWWLLKILWQALPPLPLPPVPILPPVKVPPRAAAASSSPVSSKSPSSLLGLWSLRSERIFSPVIAARDRKGVRGAHRRRRSRRCGGTGLLERWPGTSSAAWTPTEPPSPGQTHLPQEKEPALTQVRRHARSLGGASAKVPTTPRSRPPPLQ